MTEWVKRLQGYVKIRVWGFAPQRFINLCSNKGILLWNIEKQEDVYTMCIGLRSFYELRPIARKTKVRVVISERYGLPFFVPGMLRRKAFLAGLFLAVAFWLISSLFVWDIQVTGNYQVTDDVFYSFLEQEGIHTGMRRSELNIGELEKQIRRKFSQVTWTSGPSGRDQTGDRSKGKRYVGSRSRTGCCRGRKRSGGRMQRGDHGYDRALWCPESIHRQ